MESCFADRPLVSVVIPVYNREATVERAIYSVLNQTYRNIELIIVDDGSADDSFKIMKRLETENIRVIKQNHLGANAARNFGITMAKGDFIAFQDSDDEWLPHKLEKQIMYMLEQSLDACYCPFYLYANNFDNPFFRDYWDKRKYENGLMDLLKTRNVVSTQTLVIRKHIIADVGMFDEEMPRLQDYEFALRIAQKRKIGYVAEPLVRVYRSDNSISNDDEKLRKARFLLLKKYEDFFDIETGLKDLLESKITHIRELDLNEELEKADKFLAENWKRKKIDVYKSAIDILSHRYKIADDSCFREYQSRLKCLQSNEFAIYGAGDIGTRIYLELKKQNMLPRCFLVTEQSGDEEVFGIPIIEVDQWDDKNIEIIIGVSYNIQIDLIEKLLQKGYTNYFRCPYW